MMMTMMMVMLLLLLLLLALKRPHRANRAKWWHCATPAPLSFSSWPTRSKAALAPLVSAEAH